MQLFTQEQWWSKRLMHKLQIARQKLKKKAIFKRYKATYLPNIQIQILIILQDQIYNDFVGNVLNDVQERSKTDSVQSSSNYLQKLFTKNLLTAR